MSKRLIGYGYTNANGVATLDYDAEGNELQSSGYVGQGVGNVDISASAVIDGSTFVSEPLNVWDYIVYDTGKTGRDETVWTNSNMSISTDENGTTLTRTGTGSYTSNVTMTGDFEAILQLKTNGTASRVGIVDANQSSRVSQAIRTSTGWQYFKLRRVDEVLTAYESSNGTTWTTVGLESNNVGSNDCKFTFFINGSNERSITYHDLTILPL